MEKTDLFDFSFVDREREQKIFRNFISNSKKEILWINGNRGVGKSEFIKYMLNQNRQYTFVYYDVKENSKSEDVLTGFIQALQKEENTNFCDFVQKEYKKFYNNLGPTTITATKAFASSISAAVTAILDIANYVVTQNDERRETIDIVEKYIEKILSNKELFICVDNFSKSNEDIMILFCNLFKTFLDHKGIKVCIVTTEDDMDAEKKLKIQEKISSMPINIEELKEYIYFWQIMEPIFEMEDFSSDDIKYIHTKCKGKPHNLSIVISKLLEKQGILCDVSRKKAFINKSILQEVLKENSIKYNKSDFTSLQKLILFSFLCLYEGVSIQTVKELAMYISKRNILYTGFAENKFHEELLKLIEHNKLYTDGEILNTCHDSDYIDYMDIFRTSQIYRIISRNAYEFLSNHSSLAAREDLICRHMREAKIEGWKERNFLYGEKLFRNHLYFDAEKLFSCLLNESDTLNESQLLLIAINEYHVGHYSSTIRILETIQIEKLTNTSDKYYWSFYLGKSIYNYKGDVLSAIQKLVEAANYVDLTSEEYVNVQNLLQMLYIELPEKYEDALSIFTNVRNNYKTIQPNAWASTMRGCHNFLHDNYEALELLSEAHDCTNDKLEHAYIDTTRGFVYARSGNLNEAKTYFSNAYHEIKKMKSHESSYAANDLAVCYMIEDNYSKAKEILLDGLFWNKTNYGKIVLNTHLMICETFLKNSLEAEKYFDFLVNYIDNSKVQDEVILRKVLLNLSVACKGLGKPIQYEKYIKRAKEYVYNTSSEWRYLSIQEITNSSPPENIYYSYSKFDPWYIVYAHD